MYSLVGPQRSFNSSPSFCNRENRDQVTSTESRGKSATDPGLHHRLLDSPNQKNGSEVAFPPEAQEISSAYCVVQRLLGPRNGRSEVLNQELLQLRLWVSGQVLCLRTERLRKTRQNHPCLMQRHQKALCYRPWHRIRKSFILMKLEKWGRNGRREQWRDSCPAAPTLGKHAWLKEKRLY